jgi:predicted DNA-binding transcriptional regulator AlpA
MEEMDVIGVSKHCGLTKRTIYNMVSTKRIPYRRLSEKRVVFIREEIDIWLKKRQEARQQRIPLSKIFYEERVSDSLIRNEAPVTEKLATKEIKKGPSTIEKTLLVAETAESQISAARLKPSFLMRLNSFQVGILGLILVLLGWGGGILFVKTTIKTNKERSAAQAYAYAKEIEPMIGKATINSIDFDQTANEKGVIQLTLDYLSKGVELEGLASDPRIEPFLVTSLMKENEGYAVKLKVIDAVQNQVISPEIQRALIYAVAREKEPIVRLKVMTVLAKHMDSKDVREALLDRFKNDENTGIRYKALEIIESHLDENVLSIIKRVLMKESAQIIKNKAKAIIDKAGKTHTESTGI